MNKIFKLSFASLLVALMVTLGSCKKTYDNPPGPADPNIVANTSIKTLKAIHTGSGVFDLITTDLIISGVVVADDKSGNLYKQLFIQDSTGGLQILLDANSLYGTYPVGRRIYIKCNGLCISDYNGTMELGVKALVGGLPSVQGIPANLVSKFVIGGSLNNPVVPTVVTQSQLGLNGMQDKYLGMLIQLDDYAFTSLTSTYSDTSAYKTTQNLDLKNCSGSPAIILRTSAYADFAGIRVPQGRGSILAIYTIYGSTKQLIIRDTSDVRFNNPHTCGLTPGTLLLEDFESYAYPSVSPYPTLAISGWMNAVEAGSSLYTGRQFSSNKFAYVSGFGSGQNTITTWLVTKGVPLTGTTKTLTFKTIQGFILTTTPGGTPVQAALKVLVSTNYTGTGNPWAAGVIWTDLTAQCALSPGSTTSTFPSSFTNSGNINLNAYTGTIYVAFRYEGADPPLTTSDKTSAWEIDDIKITVL